MVRMMYVKVYLVSFVCLFLSHKTLSSEYSVRPPRVQFFEIFLVKIRKWAILHFGAVAPQQKASILRGTITKSVGIPAIWLQPISSLVIQKKLTENMQNEGIQDLHLQT